jgi:GAF domain-containing protein
LVYRGNVEQAYFELIAESSDEEVANIAKSNVLMEEASLGELILNQSRIELNDISQTSQLDVISLNYLISLNYTAILAVTIQFLSGEVGVIVCEHFSTPRTWSNNEVELLQAVADQLPIAL